MWLVCKTNELTLTLYGYLKIYQINPRNTHVRVEKFSLTCPFYSWKGADSSEISHTRKLNCKGVELDVEAQTLESLVDHSVLSIIFKS